MFTKLLDTLGVDWSPGAPAAASLGRSCLWDAGSGRCWLRQMLAKADAHTELPAGRRMRRRRPGLLWHRGAVALQFEDLLQWTLFSFVSPCPGAAGAALLWRDMPGAEGTRADLCLLLLLSHAARVHSLTFTSMLGPCKQSWGCNNSKTCSFNLLGTSV